MAISTSSLLYFLTDSLAAYSDDFRIINRQNPIEFVFNAINYSVHISSIHDSGNTRKNDDEERIQIRKSVIDLQHSRGAAGTVPLFLGFFSDGKVFSAWEPDHVFAQNPAKGGSVYARFSHENIARNEGAAIRVSRSKNLSREVATLSFRTEALGFYLENWGILHRLRDQGRAQALLLSAGRVIETETKSGTMEEAIQLGQERALVTVTRTAFSRDPKFRDAVLRAYGGRCCVCDRQLGLVQAAHIVPHSHPDCQNMITNGLALCVEHHRLYDDALLLPTSAGRFHLNANRVEHLQNIGQDSGLDAIQKLATGQYRVPEHVPSRPSDAFLERGVRIRLGTDA